MSLKKQLPGLGSWLQFVHFTVDNIPELRAHGWNRLYEQYSRLQETCTI